MTDVVIVEAVRTPMGRGNQRNGDLRDVHPVILAAHVLREVTGRAAIEPAMVEDVVFGVRHADRRAGGQHRAAGGARRGVPGRGSSNHRRPPVWVVAAGDYFAANLIQSGVCDITIAAGVESMSRVPMGTTVLQGPGTPFPPELLEVYNLVPQGLAAEMIAEMWHITREQADEFAARSQRRAGDAQANGRFDREIAPVVVGANGDGRVISQDQGIRPDTTVQSLAALQPAFRPDGILHAGNSSQITDGAAAVLLMSLERATALGITPRARIAAQVVVGVDPVTMLTGPIPATAKLLERSGLKIDDIDLFEVNEAFAPVVLAWSASITPTWSG